MGISKNGKRYQLEYLRPEVHKYREATDAAIGFKKEKWKPTGVTAAVILFESPVWLTKKFEIRKEDADNKIKPVLDASEKSTGIPDELHFQIHAFKIPSKKSRTIVYLFDLGDVVDYYD